MTKEKVLKVLNDISSGDPAVWVAGSAAICPALADDIDVWALKGSRLKPKDFNPDVWVDLGPIAQTYGDVLPGIIARKEATLPGLAGGESIKIQVMLTDWIDIYYGLNYFDCSCHAWARGYDGRLAASKEATLPGKPIVAKSYQTSYCGNPNCEVCAQLNAQAKWHTERVEEFLKRYANTTPDMLWLPS